MGMDVRIGTKLRVLVVGMGAVLAVTAGYGVYSTRSIGSQSRAVYVEDTTAAGMAAKAGMNLNESGINMTLALTQTDKGMQQDALRAMAISDTAADAAVQKLEDKAISENGKNEMKQLRRQIEECRDVRSKLLQQVQAGQPADLMQLAALEKQFEAIGDRLEGIYAMADGEGLERMKEMDDYTQRSIYLMTGLGILALIISLAGGFSLAASLVRRMKGLRQAADEIAEGDLAEPMEITSADELGQVASSFEKMRQSMHKAVQEIGRASMQVAAGAANVSDASVSLSQGAAEQASSVEELSSSIAEIASQTHSNAENADKANDLSLSAKDNAAVGDADMKEMLGAMEEINASSANISKIIKVIDEIAFQTNILALNAAVEAARAGQHGKGFAVVAEEVRNLAARSAKAAKETTDMIEGSIAKVNDGRAIAQKTAGALQAIVGNVSDVAELVGSIAKASNEQSQALEQINQGVLQVSQVVQSNSATAEESASASEQLSAQADMLKNTAGKFKLGVQDLEPVQEISTSSGKGVRPIAVKKQKLPLTEEEGFGKY